MYLKINENSNNFKEMDFCCSSKEELENKIEEFGKI